LDLKVVAAVFPLIFLAELPDKTMFASLVLASRGRPLAVWFGAAGAFVVHVALAVAVGAAIFTLVPNQVLDAIVAAMFVGGAIYSYLIRNQEGPRTDLAPVRSGGMVAARAAVVVFIAEWGDLTQILTANLAARYRDALSVAVAALAALWLVAALAVVSGASLLRVVSVRTLRVVTAVILLGLAVFTTVQAVRAS
jgi:putative Ca2+/H+ antiporter (TMEM165/GDT1 family)